MYWGILSEIFVFLFFVYIPGINTAFGLVSPDSIPAVCALWIAPFILGFEEIRKYLIRNNRHGCVERYTSF
jgi:hypothetical protein